MTRLLVHVEGQTEESFVNEVLRSYLLARGYYAVDAKLIGNARLRRKRGGVRSWPSARTDIVNHLAQDPGCVATTMVDYYGLPSEDQKAWPGVKQSKNIRETQRKAQHVQQAIAADVAAVMGADCDPRRFVPFVVMHEFEALLFSDCAAFSAAIGRENLQSKFAAIRQQFNSPEDINDSSVTAPSKRVEALVEGYEKPLLGVLAILQIGLAKIRQECPHFDSWIAALEELVAHD